MTRRFLADASTLIALAVCGRLPLLRTLVGRVIVTRAVLDECLGTRPGAAAIQAAVDEGWITVVGKTGSVPGLGPGESSILRAAKPSDVVVLDDRAARIEARALGLRVTGLLGLLVHGAATRKVSRSEALATLEDLAGGDFRMTAALYAWARRKLGA